MARFTDLGDLHDRNPGSRKTIPTWLRLNIANSSSDKAFKSPKRIETLLKIYLPFKIE